MIKIPDELSMQFGTQAGRKQLIELYADSDTMFFGQNEIGEKVYLSISKDGMVLNTQQENGWVRVNYYDEDGWPTGETFDGKWK